MFFDGKMQLDSPLDYLPTFINAPAWHFFLWYSVIHGVFNVGFWCFLTAIDNDPLPLPLSLFYMGPLVLLFDMVKNFF